MKFPTKGENGLKRIVIGGLLVLLSPFAIPVVLLNGYTLRAMQAGLEGAEDPPEFEDWGDMFFDGLRASAIVFVYVIVAFGSVILIAAAIGAFVLEVGSNGGAGGGALVALLTVLLSLAAIVFGALLLYLLPAALIGLASTGSLLAGIKFSSMWQLAKSLDYIKMWFVAGTVYSLGYGIILVLMITLVGIPIGLAGFFVLRAGLGHYVGDAARRMAAA
jgi:hypothetical protein